MAERYSEKVLRYCESQGIEVPLGFKRHPAKRYVAIDLSLSPPKLVATSWFKQEDMVYYLQNLAAGKPHRLLDFKEGRELVLKGERLEASGAF